MYIVIPVLLVSVLYGLTYTFPRETIVAGPDRLNNTTGAYIMPSPHCFPPSRAHNMSKIFKNPYFSHQI